MKKFGTPTGAGPGAATEMVGLAAVGAPPGVRSTGWSGAGAFGALGLACLAAAPARGAGALGLGLGLARDRLRDLGPVRGLLPRTLALGLRLAGALGRARLLRLGALLLLLRLGLARLRLARLRRRRGRRRGRGDVDLRHGDGRDLRADRDARHRRDRRGDAGRLDAVIRMHGQRGDGKDRARKRDADDNDAPIHGEPTVPSLQESPATAAAGDSTVPESFRRRASTVSSVFCVRKGEPSRRSSELRNRPPGGEFLTRGGDLTPQLEAQVDARPPKPVRLVALQSRPHATEGTDRRWPKTTRGSASA